MAFWGHGPVTPHSPDMLGFPTKPAPGLKDWPGVGLGAPSRKSSVGDREKVGGRREEGRRELSHSQGCVMPQPPGRWGSSSGAEQPMGK